MDSEFQNLLKNIFDGDCELTLFTATTYMEAPLNLGRKGFQFGEDAALISDHQVLKSAIKGEISANLGVLEANFLTNNGLILSCCYNKIKEVQPEIAEFLILEWLVRLQNILTGLWLVKDNSVNFEIGFGALSRRRRHISTSSKLLMLQYWDSHGQLQPTRWTHDELQEARRYHQNSIAKGWIQHQSEVAEAGRHSLLVRGASRQNRFFYIVDRARIEPDIGLRISNFVQSMETLFSTTKGELTYRLCLRIALLLGGDADEQRKVFKTMKDSYSVRSTVVHGSSLNPKVTRALPELSSDLESLVRRVGRRLLDDPSFFELLNLEDGKLEAVFADLVFERELPRDRA